MPGRAASTPLSAPRLAGLDRCLSVATAELLAHDDRVRGLEVRADFDGGGWQLMPVGWALVRVRYRWYPRRAGWATTKPTRHGFLRRQAKHARIVVAGSGPETLNGRGADRKTCTSRLVAVKRQPGTAQADKTGTVPPQGGTTDHTLTRAH